MLHAQNYKTAFLISEETLGGITELGCRHDHIHGYAAYVLSIETGETVEYQEFKDIDSASRYLSTLPQTWELGTLNACGDCGDCDSCEKSEHS